MRQDVRYHCGKCGTTMSDIEDVNLDKFCKLCYKFALTCWTFAIDCVGDRAIQLLLNRLTREL